MKKKLIRLTTIDNSLNILLKGQLKYLNKTFEVIGVANDSGVLSSVAKREGIRTIGVPMQRKISIIHDLRSLWALYRLFRKEHPFIVHANTPKSSFLRMVAAWFTRVPHRIYLVTGLRFETVHGPFRLLLKTMERITCFCATKVIPEGDGVKEALYREHITKKPLEKILNGNINGIDVDYFSRSKDIINQASDIRNGSNAFTFIFIGRMVRDKGINELIGAFHKLSSEDPLIRLLLVGTFEDKLDPVLPETKRLIETSENIVFVGYQNDVRPYLAASDVLILPSYREGFPNVVLQAGAMGLPCIVTDINGSNEIIIPNRNGIIIPKQNTEALYLAMKHYRQHPELVKEMAQEARPLIISRFLQQDVWNAILNMYKAL